MDDLAQAWVDWHARKDEENAEGHWVGLRVLCKPHGRALRYDDKSQNNKVEGWCEVCEPVPYDTVTEGFGRPEVGYFKPGAMKRQD